MILPLLAVTTFTFSGGSFGEFAETLGTHTGRPVVIVDTGESLRPTSRETSIVKDLAYMLAGHYGFRPRSPVAAREGILGFARFWPPRSLRSGWFDGEEVSPLAVSSPESALAQKEEEEREGVFALKDGKVSTPEGAATGPASRFWKGELHWFIRDIRLVVYADGATEADLRRAVQSALAVDDEGQPVWSELRARSIALWKEQVNRLPKHRFYWSARDHLEFKQDVFTYMPEADFRRLFSSRASRLSYRDDYYPVEAGNPVNNFLHSLMLGALLDNDLRTEYQAIVQSLSQEERSRWSDYLTAYRRYGFGFTPLPFETHYEAQIEITSPAKMMVVMEPSGSAIRFRIH